MRTRRGSKPGRLGKRPWETGRLKERLEMQYQSHSGALQQKLKAAREAAGLSQSTAATFFGRPQYWISRLETGRRAAEFIELEYLALLYGKTLSYFSTATLIKPQMRTRLVRAREDFGGRSR